MNRDKLLKLLAGLFGAAVLGGCGGGTGTTSASLMAGVDTTKFIPMSQAIEIAVAEFEGSFPVSAVLEVEDDDEKEPPAYEVTVFIDGKNDMMEVEVHAETGEVLETEVADDEADDEPNAGLDNGS